MSLAFALPLGGGALAAPDITSHLARGASADAAFQSCKTLLRCTDILERHDADSFDYAVLARDFDRFGDKSRSLLWDMIDAGKNASAKEAALANRALDILSRTPNILPPLEQRRIVQMWKSEAGAPYRAEFLARVMMTNLSPMVRSTAIQTLSHDNAEIAHYSRVILAQTLLRNMTFPMPQADLAPLSRAAVETPSPVLARLIALYPDSTATPLLSRLLKSGDSATVIAAYSALYDSDAEAAFKSLVATLYGLQPNESKAAIGLGGLLAHRHPLREDGFYMKFAKDLLSDPEMSLSGRAAGFDALLRRQGEPSVPPLPDTPLSGAAYAQALFAFSDRSTPAPYFNVPQMMNPKQADRWLEPLRRAAESPQDKIALTEVAGSFDTPLAKTIAAEAMAARGDYRLIIAGVLAQSAQARSNDIRLSSALAALSRNHPFTAVKASAALGLEALSSPNPRKTVLKLQPALPRRINTLEPRSAFCVTGRTDLRDMAKAMPFYDPAVLPGHVMADRAWFTTGARARGGWLAGYSRPQSGGLVAYNNTSGQGRELFENSAYGPQAVIAVQPIRDVPLGQTASAFWVFATSLRTGESAVYRLEQSHNDAFIITRHEALPTQPSAINISKNNQIIFAMGNMNPPLTLDANGTFRRTCNAQARAEKAPS